MERFTKVNNPSRLIKNRCNELGYSFMDVLALAGCTTEEIDLVERDCEFVLPFTPLINALILIDIPILDYLSACGYVPTEWDLAKHRNFMHDMTDEWNSYVSGTRERVSREIERRAANAAKNPKTPSWIGNKRIAKEIYG